MSRVGDWHTNLRGLGIAAGRSLRPTPWRRCRSQDRVYIHNRTPTPSLSSNREGNFLGIWGESLPRSALRDVVPPGSRREFLYLSARSGTWSCKTSLAARSSVGAVLPSDPTFIARRWSNPATDVACRARWRHLRGRWVTQKLDHQYDREARYVRSFAAPPAAEPRPHVSARPGKSARRQPAALPLDFSRGSDPEPLYVADPCQTCPNPCLQPSAANTTIIPQGIARRAAFWGTGIPV